VPVENRWSVSLIYSRGGVSSGLYRKSVSTILITKSELMHQATSNLAPAVAARCTQSPRLAALSASRSAACRPLKHCMSPAYGKRLKECCAPPANSPRMDWDAGKLTLTNGRSGSRSDSLVRALGLTVADRPIAVNACAELIAAKWPLAACGKLITKLN
jgi:hypothetical protein